MQRSLIGEQFGNYRLTALLGRGGFADVYLGEHIHLKRPAAIKVLHAHLSAQESQNFEREAQVIAGLYHPNIMHILDFLLVQGQPLLIMEYYAEGTLRKRHPRGSRVPPATVVSYVKQIADALQYAHDQKHVHHDIKPENMLVGDNGEICLSDFGIAAAIRNTNSLGTQIPIGTIAYMAPEQIQGEAHPESDQYALAVVAYEWLTGELPFSGTDTEVTAHHLTTLPPSLRDRVPELSEAVEQVILTALAKDTKDRFRSICAFATALEAAAQDGELPQVVSRQAAKTEVQSSPSPAFHQEVTEVAKPEQTPLVPPQPSSPDGVLPMPVKPASRRRKRGRDKPRRYGKAFVPVISIVIVLFVSGIAIYYNYGANARQQGNTKATQQTPNAKFAEMTETAQVPLTIAAYQGDTTATAQAFQAQSTAASLNATATFIASHPYPSYFPGHGEARSYDTLSNEQLFTASTDTTCRFADRSYHVTASEVQRIRYCSSNQVFLVNPAIEVDMEIVRGNCGGIIFRLDRDTGEMYNFAICQNGRCILFRYTANNTTPTVLYDGTSGAIRLGLGQTNRLGFVAKDALISMFVNGQPVAQFSDSTYTLKLEGGHSVGLFATNENSTTEAVFRNFAAWEAS
jgi:serine/threonine protein kinase